ncbi:MAG TPA: hypothetical protein VL172_16000 [Kofleriaceae bacterium]|nr:hypothetical protein [Kofleriaceae bacterium]
MAHSLLLLIAAWKHWHPGEPLPPACTHPDPVQTLAADVDPSRGRELVLASRRLGVALLDHEGQVLAWREIGCADPRYADDESDLLQLRAVRASGLGARDLVVHTRDFGHCGTIGHLQLLRRAAGDLVPLLEVDDEEQLMCGSSDDIDLHADLEVVRLGLVRLRRTGTVRHWQPSGDYGEPELFTAEIKYRLHDSVFVADP